MEKTSGPQRYETLKAIRMAFASFFAALFLFGLCANLGFLMDARDPLSSQVEWVPGALRWVFLLQHIGLGVLGYVFARKVGIDGWRSWLVAALAALPILTWIAFFWIVGYRPEHLKAEEPDSASQNTFPYWIVPSVPPLLLLLVLVLIRPEYFSLFFVGPPRGAFIAPSLPIPCGWPIFAALVVLMSLGDGVVWLAHHRRLVRGGWLSVLSLIVMIYFVAPTTYLALLGPATIILYKQFFAD
jgi:hypothetical protein